MSDEPTISRYRNCPIKDKPHIYFDKCWCYSLPDRMKYKMSGRKSFAWSYIKDLNRLRRGSRHAYHHNAYLQSEHFLASVPSSIPNLDAIRESSRPSQI